MHLYRGSASPALAFDIAINGENTKMKAIT